MGRAYTENISIPFGVGICGSVAETKETIYIRDAYNDTRFNREVDAQTGYTTHSLVSMPVCNADGEVIGVAQIMNKTGNGSDKSQHEFSDTDLKVFRRYLTFCGIGLQNAQLFEVSILEYKKNKVRMCNNKGHWKYENPSICEHLWLKNYMRIFLKYQCFIPPLSTNSLVNADSFYANFTNADFQKIPIPHLTRTMKQKFLH